LSISSHIVLEEGHRDNEGYKAIIKVIDDFEKFLLFICSELFLEIPHHVMEHIGVFFDRGL